MLIPWGVHHYSSGTPQAVLDYAPPGARLILVADLDDQAEACRRVFASDTRWTVVRGSDLEEGDSQGCPCGAGTSAIPSSRATSSMTHSCNFRVEMAVIRIYVSIYGSMSTLTDC